MAFEVYENATPSRDAIPFLLNVQNDLCRSFATRIVAPMTLLKPAQSVFDLCLTAKVQEQTVYCLIPQLAAVATENLGRCVTCLSDMEYDIKVAIDRMFGGW